MSCGEGGQPHRLGRRAGLQRESSRPSPAFAEPRLVLGALLPRGTCGAAQRCSTRCRRPRATEQRLARARVRVRGPLLTRPPCLTELQELESGGGPVRAPPHSPRPGLRQERAAHQPHRGLAAGGPGGPVSPMVTRGRGGRVTSSPGFDVSVGHPQSPPGGAGGDQRPRPAPGAGGPEPRHPPAVRAWLVQGSGGPGLEAGHVIPGGVRFASGCCPQYHSVGPDARAAPTADRAGRAAGQRPGPLRRPPVTGAPSSRPRRSPPHCGPAPGFGLHRVRSLDCSHGHLSGHRSAHRTAQLRHYT